MVNEVNLKNNIVIFFVALFTIWLLLLGVSIVLKTSVVGATAVAPLIAAILSGKNFVKVHGRAPNDDEVKRLTGVSFFNFIGFHLLLTVLALANPNVQGLFSQVNGAVFTMIFIFLVFYFGIAFFFIRWGYGGMTRKLAAKQDK